MLPQNRAPRNVTGALVRVNANLINSKRCFRQARRLHKRACRAPHSSLQTMPLRPDVLPGGQNAGDCRRMRLFRQESLCRVSQEGGSDRARVPVVRAEGADGTMRVRRSQSVFARTALCRVSQDGGSGGNDGHAVTSCWKEKSLRLP